MITSPSSLTKKRRLRTGCPMRSKAHLPERRKLSSRKKGVHFERLTTQQAQLELELELRSCA